MKYIQWVCFKSYKKVWLSYDSRKKELVVLVFSILYNKCGQKRQSKREREREMPVSSSYITYLLQIKQTKHENQSK